MKINENELIMINNIYNLKNRFLSGGSDKIFLYDVYNNETI